MKMSKKLAVILAVGMLAPAASAMPKLETLLSTAEKNLGIGWELATGGAATVRAYVESNTPATIKSKLSINLNEETTLRDLGYGAPTHTNNRFVTTSMLAALYATGVVSKNNSLPELGTSALWAVLGTRAALNQYKKGNMKSAILAYLVGQNGNAAIKILQHVASHPMQSIEQLCAGRWDRNEVKAAIVATLAPFVAAYGEGFVQHQLSNVATRTR